MKYKKKLGGSPPTPSPQQITVVIPQPKGNDISNTSNTPSISSSVSNSVTNFKETYSKIIIFIKSNFIFCLLVGLLLIVYIFLFSSPTVTEEDLKKLKEESKIKCDKFTTPCSPGTKLAKNNECKNNECDEDTCCISDVDCSTYLGICDKGKILTTDNSKKCETDKCTAKDCCLKSCSDFKGCPTNKFLNKKNTCKTDACKGEECCVTKHTCASTDSSGKQFECGNDYKLKKDPGTIFCNSDTCLKDECCDFKNTDDTSNS